MPRVCITGGAGFIGQALGTYLVDRGFSVRIFDIAKPKVAIGEYVEGTIMDVAALAEAFRSCDYVVHLAAHLGVKRTEGDRMGCLDMNIIGTKNVLDACIHAKVKKIIFPSSAEIYGEPAKTPITEDDAPSPQSVYAVTKLVGEKYVEAYNQHYGLDYTVLRFFNIYGPGQTDEFVLPKFIKAAQNGTPITIHSDGSQMRSFCYVDDAVQSIYLALEKETARAQVFNIANDTAVISIAELTREVMARVRRRVPVHFADSQHHDRLRAREVMKSVPDITKARTLLGFSPRVPIGEGIGKMLAWDEQNNT